METEERAGRSKPAFVIPNEGDGKFHRPLLITACYVEMDYPYIYGAHPSGGHNGQSAMSVCGVILLPNMSVAVALTVSSKITSLGQVVGLPSLSLAADGK